MDWSDLKNEGFHLWLLISVFNDFHLGKLFTYIYIGALISQFVALSVINTCMSREIILIFPSRVLEVAQKVPE